MAKAKLKGDIRLFCRDCGKEQPYSRLADSSIPNTVKTISSQCPECNGGDFSEEIWLDVAGREVSQDDLLR